MIASIDRRNEMPSLNFQERFAVPIAAGQKRQTIRNFRANGIDPKPGDTLYLFTGMRSKSCRKIGEVRCRLTSEVEIGEDRLSVAGLEQAGEKRDLFARADGFADFAEMRGWFEKQHGLPFRGLLIRW
jgi:hypothetical protein